MTETFTPDELIAALTSARRGPEEDPEAHTVQELVKATGRSEVIVARRLRELMDAGLVECVRKPWVRIDNVMTTVPAYRLRRQDDDDNGRGTS